MKHPFLNDDVDDALRRLNNKLARTPSLEGDWCRPGLPGGISALRATLAPATTSKVAAPAPPAAVPATAPVLAPVAVIRPPWYLGYTLWTRGLWPKRKTA